MRMMSLLFASVVLCAAPLSASACDMQSGERASLEQASDDMAFVSGGEVRVAAEVADDIFAAGGRVAVDGAHADHLMLAGGEVEVNATARDVIAAGGRLALRNGEIADDVVAAGGEVRLAPDFHVAGSAMITGGDVRIEAPIARSLVAAGGRVELNANVGAGARIAGETIVIGPNARIGGDLTLRGRTIEISPQAVISGQTIRQPMPERRGGAAALAFFAGAVVIGMLILLAAIAAFLPKLTKGAAQRLQANFWPMLGIGALIVLVGPLLVGALFATLIGAPVAAFLVLAYLAALAPAFAVVAYTIGMYLRARFAKQTAEPRVGARIGWTMLGALLLMIVCAIPLIGALVWLIALIGGIGAVLTHASSALSKERPA